MIYGWIVDGLATLDLGIKSMIENEEDDIFPGDLPSAKDLIKVHGNHDVGFPFGFMEERPELVRGIPFMVISAMAGVLCTLLRDKGKTAQKAGIAIIIDGALSNFYSRVVRGYVVDCLSIEWEPTKRMVFNLGGMFVFLESTTIILEQTAGSLTEVREKK